MKKFQFEGTIWTRSLVLMASTVFLQRFGEGLLWATRNNFFVNTLGLDGGQVLWLEGIREIPGLGLILIAALTMRLPLSWRSAASLFILGVGFALYATINSYVALVAIAVLASVGMHMWMPLRSTLAMSLTTKDKAGQVLGILASVGGLASIAGMGVLAVVSRLFESISLRTYYVGCGFCIILAAFLVVKIPKSVGATEFEQPRMLLKPRYWLFYVLTFLQGARKYIFDSFVILVLVDKFDLAVWNIGALLFVSSVLNMVTAPYVGRLIDRLGERRVLPLSYVFLIFCCIGFAVIRSVWILAVLLIAVKLLILFGMGLSTYVRRISPQEELTPTLSAGITINHITSVAVPLIARALLSFLKYDGIFWSTAALMLISIPFALALRVSDSTAAQVEFAAAE
ncbi:MFS transporter [Candidatus Poribacteria bacterium]